MSSWDKIKEEFDECFNLMKARSLKYGDSWKDARLSSLVDYAIMKYKRVSEMVLQPVENRQKIESDLRDMINYAIFALLKLKKIEKE